MIQKRVCIPACLLAGILIIAISSCKRYPDVRPVFEKYGNDSTGEMQRKVLVISIDGATGSEIQKIAPPNIKDLQKHSKYSYKVFRGMDASDAGTWVSMLTGVSQNKHQISDSSFEFNASSSDIGGSEDNPNFVPNFPTVFSYILQSKPDYKTAVITPWTDLANYTRIVDYNIAANNDESAKDSAVSILNSVSPLGLMVVDFNEVELAGNAGSFSATDPAYKSAVMKADSYIGDIMKALQDRKNYSKENWLVIITTNHGGSTMDTKEGFVLCYNPSLSEEEIRQKGFNTIRFTGKEVKAIVPNDNGLYNFGANKDFTLQMQIEFNNTSRWPGFFGKSDGLHGQNITGWLFMQSTNHYGFVTGGVDNGGSAKNQANAQDRVSDGFWHTITVTVKTEDDGKRMARLYVDGKFNAKNDITSNGNLDSPAPLTLGYVYVDGWPPSDFYASGLEIFDVALDSETIAKNIALKDITKHPDYNHLIGYWLFNSGAGQIIANKAPRGYDMVLQGPYKWASLGDNVPIDMTPDSSVGGLSILPEVQDVSTNILYWLKIKISKDWNMDGTPWLNNFEQEIYGLK